MRPAHQSTIATTVCVLMVLAVVFLKGFPVQSFQYAPTFNKLTLLTTRPNAGLYRNSNQTRNRVVWTMSSSSSSDSDLSGENSSKGDQSLSTIRALPASKSLDTGAILRYGAAFVIQMTLIAGVFSGLDALTSIFKISPSKIPMAINVVLFYGFALKSRILNPLDNQRPQTATKEIKGDTQNRSSSSNSSVDSPPPRTMPSWTPPGFVFPIVWLLIIGPLRAVSSSLVYQATGRYFSTAIMSLMAHLTIGDIWNTINNKERRYGTSVVGVLMVWASAAFAAYQYSLVAPLAGRLLSLPLIWLTIASSLIVRTWQLNPAPDTGKPESLLPTKDVNAKTITKLMWFEK
ncbi:TspO/MBR family protein [Nitzschia inconspicua]|uniref:TspO/MBR family protein n=1 Tax=Nitzschia inconspicua TaxID=303405 RepID=A0A9K3PI68_9STRA|nr:TspO/MBR family protein [Nitzschia inconspicua]